MECLPKSGRQHAINLFLTGERFSAPQAVARRLGHRAVASDQITDAVQREIERIGRAGPTAVAEAR